MVKHSMLQRQCSRSICYKVCHLKTATCAATRSAVQYKTPRLGINQHWHHHHLGSTIHDAFPRRLPQRRAPHCSASAAAGRHKLVFLGTPQVAASVLEVLFRAAEQPDASFEVAAVVTQPERPKGRHKVPQPSPVAQAALARGLDSSRLLSPVRAREEGFLRQLAGMKPDLCVTAAYGNVLPLAFLEIPAFGTLNIHPSLLPKYRGASPVQRALQDGVRETGVSVAFTVRAMDAGPVLAQERVHVGDAVQAPELLDDLFARGAALLLARLPDVWTGRAAQLATPQDESAATHAAKLDKAEGQLDFREAATVVHNKVRGFAGWPGTYTVLHVGDEAGRLERALDVRITRTEVLPGQASRAPLEGNGPAGTLEVALADGMVIECGNATYLGVLELQPAGKNAMSAAAFRNGLKGRRVWVQRSYDAAQ